MTVDLRDKKIILFSFAFYEPGLSLITLGPTLFEGKLQDCYSRKKKPWWMLVAF
jgi:hypothetical protein